jgi:hypothetical protein
MKHLFIDLFKRNQPVIFGLMVVLVLAAACKKDDSDVTLSNIENTLDGGNSRQWYIHKLIEVGNTVDSSLLVFNSDHSYTYLNGSYKVTGTWEIDYTANRSGQEAKLILNATAGNSKAYDLRYSAESGIVYYFDPGTLILYPFKKPSVPVTVP